MIHQILVSAAPGDAITNMALSMRDLLRQVGDSEIYARHIAPELWNEVRQLEDYTPRHSRNILVVHASIGEPVVHEFLSDRNEALVLVYHNVTPADYFEPYDLAFAELLAMGRREVQLLRPRVISAIADSQYNARELEAIGYRDVHVIPPIMHMRRLAGIEPRPSTLNHLGTFEAPILLSVAQLMPHKRPDFLVAMMHCAETYGVMRPALMFVGHQRLARYTNAIREQVRELMVDAHMVGVIDDADLVAMFHAAAVVVTASEHEGFCIPLVEAMSFGKPIVARACAAIPETVGDAALLVPPNQGPQGFSEVTGELLYRPELQAELVARGKRRVAELQAMASDEAIVGALLEAM
jgi:L-malate glycosyltransferase